MSFVVVKKKPGGSQEKPLFIVLKKAEYKKATKRNLIRRRIKSIMNPLVAKREKNNHYCVIVKPGADMVSFQELKNEILRQLNAGN